MLKQDGGLGDMIKNRNYTGQKKWRSKSKIKISLICCFTVDI